MPAVLLVLLLVACDGGSGGAYSGGPQGALSCEALGDHLNAVCSPIDGEILRASCEIVPGLVSDQTRRCVANLRDCSEDAVSACDITSVSVICDSDAECPGLSSCDEEQEVCVRCMEHADCAEGRGCIWGKCYDMDTPFFETLSELIDDDAGVP